MNEETEIIVAEEVVEKDFCGDTDKNTNRKAKKQVSRKKVMQRRRGIFFTCITIFLGLLIAGSSIVGIMNKPRKAVKGTGDYEDLTALQTKYNLDPVRDITEYKDILGNDLWLTENEKSNDLVATSDETKKTAYEIFSVIYSKLLRRENVQALTDGRTKVGGVVSPCQNDKKLVTTYHNEEKQQDMFINIWGNAMNMGIPDERHYLNLTKKKVKTNNTQFSKGWLDYEEADYVANYMYQARWFHHTVSLESINKVYFHKVDEKLIKNRDAYIINRCRNAAFCAGGLNGFKAEDYSARFSGGDYYEIMFYLDGKISGKEIERQTKAAANAKDLKYTGNAVVCIVTDENYVVQATLMYEKYNLINPYGLAIKGQAENTVSEFYYYDDKMWSNDSNGGVKQGYVGFTGIEDVNAKIGAGMATLDKIVSSVFSIVGILCGSYVVMYIVWKFTGLGIIGLTKVFAGMDEILWMSGKPVKDFAHRKKTKQAERRPDSEPSEKEN